MLHVHLPLKDIVEYVLVKESNFPDEVLQFIREGFVVVLVDGAELFIKVADVPGPHDEDKCLFELVEEGG